MNNTTANLVDEFGRDNRLRKPAPPVDVQTKLLQGKSWAEITWEIEEEEEKELAALETERQSRLNQLVVERKTLLLKSEYHLEDGEIFE